VAKSDCAAQSADDAGYFNAERAERLFPSANDAGWLHERQSRWRPSRCFSGHTGYHMNRGHGQRRSANGNSAGRERGWQP
jgi:hypothetical protein